MRTQPFTFRKIEAHHGGTHEAIQIRTRYGSAVIQIASGQSDDVDVVRDGDTIYVVSRNSRRGYAGVERIDLTWLFRKAAPGAGYVLTLDGRDVVEGAPPVYLDAGEDLGFYQDNPEELHPRIFDVSAFAVVRAALSL